MTNVIKAYDTVLGDIQRTRKEFKITALGEK